MTTAALSRSTPPEPLDECALARRFSVRAAVEPSVLSRVVEQFVLRDLIPQSVTSQVLAGRAELRVDLEVTGLTTQQAEHVAQRIRQFPPVLGVLMETSSAA